MPVTGTSVQTAALNRHSGLVQQAAERLRAQRFLQRLWRQDASLWSNDPAVQSSIKNRLGWLSISEVLSQQTEAVSRLVQEIRSVGFTHALLLGMGGSGLFAEVCRQTFGVAPGHLDLAVLDTTDPTAIRSHQSRCDPAHLCVIVSSKSGSTIEVASLAKYFYSLLTPLGNPGDHCLAITDCGTPLETQAKAQRFRRVLTHGCGTGAEVGGRFSALTYFGLVPAALIGADINRLLRRADEMLARCGSEASFDDNPALQLGAALGALAQAGVDTLTLLCAPPIASFGTWVEQLIAESTGKKGQGIVPIHGEPVREPAGYGSDRVFVELQLASELDKTLERQVDALESAGHPVIRIRWQDRYDLGGEAVKWFIATTIAGSLLGIDPFDEPNVKESKDRTKALLERYVRDRRFDEGQPCCSDEQFNIYGPSGQPGPVASCLSAFFQQRRPDDYVALLSFLPRTAVLDRAAQTLREWFAERLRVATMLQFGPRYLHSTGQLYKGGPNHGLFLLFTADERCDLPIPGEHVTFATLKQAQALGDFDAMRDKGRRILRVHLRGDHERAMQRLTKMIEEALALEV